MNKGRREETRSKEKGVEKSRTKKGRKKETCNEEKKGVRKEVSER